MKRSKAVPALLVSTVASATLAGCGSTANQTRDCVDRYGRVLSDDACEQALRERNSRRTSQSAHFYPHYIYGGSYSSVNRRVTGGSIAPSASSGIVTRSGSVIRGGSVSRGGFGSFGSGRGGFSFGS